VDQTTIHLGLQLLPYLYFGTGFCKRLGSEQLVTSNTRIRPKYETPWLLFVSSHLSHLQTCLRGGVKAKRSRLRVLTRRVCYIVCWRLESTSDKSITNALAITMST